MGGGRGNNEGAAAMAAEGSPRMGVEVLAEEGGACTPPVAVPSLAEREEVAGRLVRALVRSELGAEGALGAEGEQFLARELAGAAAALARAGPAVPGDSPPPVSHPPALLLRDFLASPRPLPELEALAGRLLTSILSGESPEEDFRENGGGDVLACLRAEFPMFEEEDIEVALRGACGSLEGAREALLEMFEAELEPRWEDVGEGDGGPGPGTAPGPSMDEANFPGLGGSDGGGAAAAAGARGSGEKGSGSGSSSWATAARTPAAIAAPGADRVGPPRGGGAPSSPSLVSAYRGGRPGGGSAAGVGRVSTGAAVAQDYAQVREEAARHALARNACFEGATRAFQAGNKAAAKELGRKGRWHNEQMKGLHEAAARETFKQRNAPGGGAGGGARTIDLHGLHVAEAVRFLAEELEGQRRGARIFVVVGTGHHSHYTQGGKRGSGGGEIAPRLAAAVEAFLAERGLTFSSPEAGLLQVTV